MASDVWDFLITFFILFIVLVIVVIFLVFRAKPNQKEAENVNDTQVLIKEVIKVRCRYCGYTYDQGLDKCPNCGART